MQWAGCTQTRCRINRTLRRPTDRAPVKEALRVGGSFESSPIDPRPVEACKHAGAVGAAVTTRAMAGHFIPPLP
jgi:hypothetical protein